MPKFPVVKGRQLMAVLARMGFTEYHRVGSHAQFKHPDGRRVTIAIHAGRDFRKGTMRGILSDINLTVEDFISLLKNK